MYFEDKKNQTFVRLLWKQTIKKTYIFVKNYFICKSLKLYFQHGDCGDGDGDHQPFEWWGFAGSIVGIERFDCWMMELQI